MEHSAGVSSTGTCGGDTFEESFSGPSAEYSTQPMRVPVNEEVPSYLMFQCPDQVAARGDKNDFHDTFGQSSFDGATGYHDPKDRFKNEMSNSGIIKDPKNNVYNATPDAFHETIEQHRHFIQEMAEYNSRTQLSTDRSHNSNALTCSNATIDHNTSGCPGSVELDANFQYGVDYYGEVQVLRNDHSHNVVESNSGSNGALADGTAFFPGNVKKVISNIPNTVVATGDDPVIVKGSGEYADWHKEVSPGTAEQCTRDNSPGCAKALEDSHTAHSAKVATPEVQSAEEMAVPWEIGPQACPSGCAEEMKSLELQAALESLKPSERKLKWPLPIPLFAKPRDKSLSFRFVDYGWLSQCVYLAAQEEVFAQMLDQKGWLRIFVKSTRAAHNLVQTETLAGMRVKCSVANSYSNSVGYVHNVPRRYTDTALFEILQDQGVICAQRQSGFKRYNNGSVGDMATGTVVLTFLPDRRLPTTVTIGLISYEVTRRLTLPTQCFNCQRFGHYARNCTRSISCRLCGGSHFYTECKDRNKPHCVNCGEGHPSTYWRCPVRLTFASSDPRNSLRLESVVKL
ncbi:hypothetical protein MTO96_032322 [Rhipicephalus appendiculatus]